MKRWINAAGDYIRTMDICDVALMKICVGAAGIMLGMVIPKKGRKTAALIASTVFAVTYVLVMVPFLKRLEEKET